MITLTAEVLCDSCGKVCGVGEPTAPRSSSSGHKSHWAMSAIESAEAKARSHGAQINVATTTCAECLKKPKPTQFVGWTTGDGSGHEGYNVSDYFDSSGNYLGPDEHGIEPIFNPQSTTT